MGIEEEVFVGKLEIIPGMADSNHPEARRPQQRIRSRTGFSKPVIDTSAEVRQGLKQDERPKTEGGIHFELFDLITSTNHDKIRKTQASGQVKPVLRCRWDRNQDCKYGCE